MDKRKKAGAIRVFSSFEEARNEEDERAANQAPLEHMAATLILINAVYNYKIDLKMRHDNCVFINFSKGRF